MSQRTYIPVLIAQTGPASGQTWPLAKDQLTIGRDAECDIVIPDRQVSRVHAQLRRIGSTFTVEDLQSKNGTHLNGTRLEQARELQDGDLIQVAFVAKLQYVGSEATMPIRLDLAAPDAAPTARPARLRLDIAARRMWITGRELDPPLSVPQFRLIHLLYQHAGEVCGREDVIQTVWPDAASAGVSEQAIDALVRRTRDRLAELDPDHQYLVTVRGHGFRLDNPELEE